MKWIISSLMISFLTLSFAQEVNQVDAQGRKQGKWEKIYPGTRVYQYRGQFKNDKPVGKFTYFYKSTKLKAVIEHSENSNRSVGYYYHPTGGIMSYGIFRSLKKDSIWTNLDRAGKLASKETFKGDSLHGQKVVFYPPGEGARKQMPSALFTYKNGALDGEYKEFFASGKTKVRGNYQDNRKHGTWERYHNTGKKMSFERYKDGRKHGWCHAYDKSGKEIAKKYFYYGRLLEGKQLKKKMQEMKRLGINPNE